MNYEEKNPQKQGAYPPPTDPKLMLNLQMYDQSRPPPKKNIFNDAVFMPMTSTGVNVPPQYLMPQALGGPATGFGLYEPAKLNVIKNYSINTGGPIGDHGMINAVFEDIMPKSTFSTTMITVKERLDIHKFVRATNIKVADGEDVNIDPGTRGEVTNLLSSIKFMELNPYNTNAWSSNPYKGLPDNMLIYRSCYPMRWDERTNTTRCASASVGMNIRIYRLSLDEYKIRNTSDTSGYFAFEAWRELRYYEFVRDSIVKKLMSPNFVMLHAYFICEKCSIDFNKVNKTRLANVVNNAADMTIKDKGSCPNYVPNKAVIALTESPTYNFYDWASKTYNVEGSRRKMVNTGYHTSDVWWSILFQIMAAFAVMEKEGFCFTEFDLVDHVYIKDLTKHDNQTTYWIYKIDGIEYYVPNVGYLVMFDSNFKVVEGPKIVGKIFSETTDVKPLVLSAFKQTLTPNAFSNSFISKGAVKPPDDVMTWLETVSKDVNDSVFDYIKKHMTMFIHDRIGTLLKASEIGNIKSSSVKEFKKGDIIVHKVKHNTFTFVIFLKRDGAQVTIITKNTPDDKNYIEREVLIHNVSVYTQHTKIEQTNPNVQLNAEPLEIYQI